MCVCANYTKHTAWCRTRCTARRSVPTTFKWDAQGLPTTWVGTLVRAHPQASSSATSKRITGLTSSGTLQHVVGTRSGHNPHCRGWKKNGGGRMGGIMVLEGSSRHSCVGARGWRQCRNHQILPAIIRSKYSRRESSFAKSIHRHPLSSVNYQNVCSLTGSALRQSREGENRKSCTSPP